MISLPVFVVCHADIRQPVIEDDDGTAAFQSVPVFYSWDAAEQYVIMHENDSEAGLIILPGFVEVF